MPATTTAIVARLFLAAFVLTPVYATVCDDYIGAHAVSSNCYYSDNYEHCSCSCSSGYEWNYASCDLESYECSCVQSPPPPPP